MSPNNQNEIRELHLTDSKKITAFNAIRTDNDSMPRGHRQNQYSQQSEGAKSDTADAPVEALVG